MLLNDSRANQTLVKIPENFLPDVVIYHNVVKNFACPDGIASAWVCYRKYQYIADIEYLGWTYDDENSGNIPDLSNYQNVLVVDFSFNPVILDLWRKQGKNVYVIDHHQGFMERVKASSYTFDNLIFDEKECGATLTWKTLFPYESVPRILEYVRDRDLFLKSLPSCDEVFSGMSKLGRTFSLFDQLYELERIDFELVLNFLVPIGTPSVLKKREKIQKYLEKTEFYGSIPVVTLNKSDIALKSDLGEVLNFYYPWCKFAVIRNRSELESVRLRSSIYTNNTDLIELFSDVETISGLATAANFKWFKSEKELKELIISKSL